MRQLRYCILALVALASLTLLVFAARGAGNSPAVAGGLGIGFLATRRFRRKPGVVAAATPSKRRSSPLPATECDAEADESTRLVEQMLGDDRYALLLRPQVVGSLTRRQLDRVTDTLQAAMAMTPEGPVDLTPDLDLPPEEADLVEPVVVQVDGFYLDRYTVTNQQFARFVAAGGYEQMAFWEESVWSALLDFVDSTGVPGPKFWRDGACLPGTENQPVTGVSWYEACAYARWAGKRLPTDAEWLKAASWPVRQAGGGLRQRRYPWGDAFDRAKANLWGSQPAQIVDVDDFSSGISLGGAYQMVGNVWEWTATTMAGAETGGVMLKSLRGGAYDTYFETQACCRFQSGDDPLARRHNVGFRCAVGVGDLALDGEPDEPVAIDLDDTDLAETCRGDPVDSQVLVDQTP